MILDATNQKQAINEYAKIGSNGFLGRNILLEMFFFCVFWLFLFFVFVFFSQKKGNLVVGSVRVAAGRKRNSIFVFSGAQSLPKR